MLRYQIGDSVSAFGRVQAWLRALNPWLRTGRWRSLGRNNSQHIVSFQGIDSILAICAFKAFRDGVVRSLPLARADGVNVCSGALVGPHQLGCFPDGLGKRLQALFHQQLNHLRQCWQQVACGVLGASDVQLCAKHITKNVAQLAKRVAQFRIKNVAVWRLSGGCFNRLRGRLLVSNTRHHQLAVVLGCLHQGFGGLGGGCGFLPKLVHRLELVAAVLNTHAYTGSAWAHCHRLSDANSIFHVGAHAALVLLKLLAVFVLSDWLAACCLLCGCWRLRWCSILGRCHF